MDNFSQIKKKKIPTTRFCRQSTHPYSCKLFDGRQRLRKHKDLSTDIQMVVLAIFGSIIFPSSCMILVWYFTVTHFQTLFLMLFRYTCNELAQV